jgi:hypothetical protein
MMNMTYKEMIDALDQVDCDNRGSQTILNEVVDALRLKDIVNVGRIREERASQPLIRDFNPPAEVIAAAQLLEEYFLREHNMSEWQFMGVQSRTEQLAAPKDSPWLETYRDLSAQGERQPCHLCGATKQPGICAEMRTCPMNRAAPQGEGA